MVSLSFGKVRRILCLGAHPDDIEIGCGGTLLKLLGQNPPAEVQWVVFSGNRERRGEARRSAESTLRRAGRRRIEIKSFRESYFPDQWGAIKRGFVALAKRFDPDVIFTHYRDDRHQDHRVLSDLTWNAFRSHCILEYEVPKYDGDVGQPNTFVVLEEKLCREKVEGLMRHFVSQRAKHWFSADTFHALLRLRGVECASPSGLAEGFYGRKLVL